MGPVDIRRLAAIDMHGAGGGMLRRRIILAEFVLGAVLGTVIGVVAALGSDSLGWRIFGLWVALGCLNYVPLAIHAFTLYRDEALQAELAGVDIMSELHRYTKAQFWIAIPLLFVVTAIPQAMGRRPVHG